MPIKIEELITLPGVGRKTANVLLGVMYNIPGIVVDTHVTRITRLLKLTYNIDAVKIESDLMKIIDEEHWIIFAHLLIDHGRAICIARRPKCSDCILLELCPFGLKNNNPKTIK